MSFDDFPNEFDIIILGTGLTSTITAAAFSRIGLKILHLDRNDYYGGTFGNFNLDGLNDWKEKQIKLKTAAGVAVTPEKETPPPNTNTEGLIRISLPEEKAHAFNLSFKYYVRERTAEEEAAAKASRTFPFQFSSQKTSKPKTEDVVGVSQQEKDKASYSHEQNSSGVASEALENKEKEETQQINSEGDACDKSENNEEHDKSKSNKAQSLISETNVIDAECENNPPKNKQAEKEAPTTQDLQQIDGDSAQGLTSSVSTQQKTEDSSTASEKPEVGNTEASDTQSASLQQNAETEKQRREWTVGDIKDGWRRFALDLSPKVLHCYGDIVQLLVRSDVARYCEFRSVNRVLTLLKDKLEEVPCSRANLFSSKIVSLIEKRLMMKFLQFAADYENHADEYEAYKDQSFTTFLKSMKLTANLQHFVQHSIAMVPDSCTTQEGLAKTQKFLKSLNLYSSDGAFLFPMYGTGELSQAFSRMSAVFGGVYCLTQSATHILRDADSKCTGVILTSGQKVDCKYLIAEASYLPNNYVQRLSSGKISRGTYITDASIHPSSADPLTLLNYMCKDDSSRPITVLEIPSSAGVCPKHLYVVYLTRSTESEDPEKDLGEARERLFSSDVTSDNDERPRVLWSMHFTLEDWSSVSLTDEAVSNVLVASEGGDAGVDVDFCVAEAKKLFHTVCPDEEFLPTPPNPEDIIHGEGEQKTEESGEKGEDNVIDDKTSAFVEETEEKQDEKKTESDDTKQTIEGADDNGHKQGSSVEEHKQEMETFECQAVSQS